MPNNQFTDISYYPGCSLATTAKENNRSLNFLFRHLGYNLVELEDWNCCGSSSAHSVDKDLAFDLASRNLSLAPPDRPGPLLQPHSMRSNSGAQRADKLKSSTVLFRWPLRVLAVRVARLKRLDGTRSRWLVVHRHTLLTTAT